MARKMGRTMHNIKEHNRIKMSVYCLKRTNCFNWPEHMCGVH